MKEFWAMRIRASVMVLMFSLSFLVQGVLPAQEASPAAGASKPVFKAEELEQLVAPVALYPDSVLSQVFIAATYPLEIVEASRWLKQKANAALKDDALAAALEKQTWDPSVKSLVNFPPVLSMMDEKLDWTQKLGDAVLAQKKEVMDAVQRLRSKAKAAGNLADTKEQKVVVEQETIIIQSADPQVVYIPACNPTVVYGPWPYPAYPPYYYYPPGHPPTAPAFTFMVGVAVGVAWGYAWGGCNWHHGDIDIDINKNVNLNRNINRQEYKNKLSSQPGSGTSWQHDASHRKGVSYRDAGTAQRFQKTTAGDAAARQQFRGFADSGRQELGRDGGSSAREPLSRTGEGAKPSAGNREAPARPATQPREPAAFEGLGKGSDVKSQSSRGLTSRQSSPSPKARSGGGARGGRR